MNAYISDCADVLLSKQIIMNNTNASNTDYCIVQKSYQVSVDYEVVTTSDMGGTFQRLTVAFIITLVTISLAIVCGIIGFFLYYKFKQSVEEASLAAG